LLLFDVYSVFIQVSKRGQEIDEAGQEIIKIKCFLFYFASAFDIR